MSPGDTLGDTPGDDHSAHGLTHVRHVTHAVHMTHPSTVDPTGTVPAWTLGWRLRRALAHAELRAEDIADELGVVRATVSRWMNDKGAPPRRIYLSQWALRTGVPLSWLLTGETPVDDQGIPRDPSKGINRH